MKQAFSAIIFILFTHPCFSQPVSPDDSAQQIDIRLRVMDVAKNNNEVYQWMKHFT